eukprot:CAMPEP_0196661810 /NCGR_PEP_ID=MMETSP1086-20130531/45946_1 /TAXON_ID=77921 /ORGANISM="Cyanoptyche  gloeocystis , Strain SAG4.97" /LENGTH=320 /DNA_ID=CAMNT_0041996887 /DNA_START=377 /DNA_END=1339 /DNA_ORIENTATION=-
MGPEQLQLLQDHFKRNERLDGETKNVLAEKLKLPPRQIEVWFQNCRVRAKKKKTEERCALYKEQYQQQLQCQANLEEDNKRLQRDNAQLKRYIRALLLSTASHIPPHILTANLVAANLMPDSSAATSSSPMSSDRALFDDTFGGLIPPLSSSNDAQGSSSTSRDPHGLDDELRRIHSSASGGLSSPSPAPGASSSRPLPPVFPQQHVHQLGGMSTSAPQMQMHQQPPAAQHQQASQLTAQQLLRSVSGRLEVPGAFPPRVAYHHNLLRSTYSPTHCAPPSPSLSPAPALDMPSPLLSALDSFITPMSRAPTRSTVSSAPF